MVGYLAAEGIEAETKRGKVEKDTLGLCGL